VAYEESQGYKWHTAKLGDRELLHFVTLKKGRCLMGGCDDWINLSQGVRNPQRIPTVLFQGHLGGTFEHVHFLFVAEMNQSLHRNYKTQ